MAALKELGFQHYNEVEGPLCGVQLLVIQYESSYRLFEDGRLTPYDYVVIDEVRAVTGQMLSHTNGKKLGVHALIYHCLLTHARKGVLLMDADLEADKMVYDLVNEIWKKDEQRVRRYTHVALKRAIALVDETSWYACVDRDIQAGRKLFSVFRERREMRSWIKAQLKRGKFSYLAIDGSTSEEELARIFEDINTSVRGVQVVCITSKVTTGADIQERFHRIYANCKTFSGPTARDVYQMICRARNVDNTEIVALLPSPRGDNTVQLKQRAKHELSVLKGMQAARKNYAAMSSCQLILGPDGKISWSDSWLLKLAAHHAAEQAECFCVAFHRHTLRKGYSFVDPAPFIVEESKEGDEPFITDVEESRLLHDDERKAAAKLSSASCRPSRCQHCALR